MRWGLARLTSNGTLDSTFGTANNGLVTTLVGSGTDYGERVVVSGTQIILGSSASNGTYNDFAIAALQQHRPCRHDVWSRTAAARS